MKLPSLLLAQVICSFQDWLFIDFKIRLKFDRNCLQQSKISHNHEPVVNLCIVYEINLWPKDLYAKFTIGICLFGAVRLTKNAGEDKYRYSNYGIEFNGGLSSSITRGNGFSKNVIISGVDNISSF